MSTTRTAIAALAATLAAAALSATVGLAAMPAHATPATVDAWTPTAATPAPATPPTMTVDEVAGWTLYRSEISDSDGCWEDFASSYLGWTDAPKGAETKGLYTLPEGTDWYLVLAPYRGACHNA